MTQELRRQHAGLIAASDLIDTRRRFTEAVLSGVSPGVIGLDAAGFVTIANPGGGADAGPRERGARGPAARPGRARTRPGAGGRGGAPACAAPAADPAHPRARRAHGDRARHRRAVTRRRPRLRGDPRRHHRPRPGPAHCGLGRRRAPHRPRDQEPADPDPALGRAHPAQVRQGHHHRQGSVRPVHGDDRAPSGRDQTHGRRVLGLRADAQARDRAQRPHRDRQAEPVHDARRTPGHRLRVFGPGRRRGRGEDRGGLRHPPAEPSDHQHPQERRRGGDRGAGGRARQGQGSASASPSRTRSRSSP